MGREPYGDGVPIVVVRVTPHRGERESRLQGEGEQVARCREPCGTQVAESHSGIEHRDGDGETRFPYRRCKGYWRAGCGESCTSGSGESGWKSVSVIEMARWPFILLLAVFDGGSWN